MVPFSSSPQIHLPGQLLTPPANSQDEDLVTFASNRSRFIDMWGWLSFSGAAVHRINFNCSRMFSAALQIPKCLTALSFRGGGQFLPGAGLSLVAWAFSNHTGHCLFLIRGRNLSKLPARTPSLSTSFKLPLSLSEICKESAKPASKLGCYKTIASCCFKSPYLPTDTSGLEAGGRLLQASPLTSWLCVFWASGHNVKLCPHATNPLCELTFCATVLCCMGQRQLALPEMPTGCRKARGLSPDFARWPFPAQATFAPGRSRNTRMSAMWALASTVKRGKSWRGEEKK